MGGFGAHNNRATIYAINPVVLLYLLQDFAIIIKAYYEPLPLLLVSCLTVVCVYACLCVWGWGGGVCGALLYVWGWCVMPLCVWGNV